MQWHVHIMASIWKIQYKKILLFTQSLPPERTQPANHDLSVEPRNLLYLSFWVTMYTMYIVVFAM